MKKSGKRIGAENMQGRVKTEGGDEAGLKAELVLLDDLLKQSINEAGRSSGQVLLKRTGQNRISQGEHPRVGRGYCAVRLVRRRGSLLRSHTESL